MDNKGSASGVQQLIHRLREQGVEEGKKQADELLEESRHRALALLEDAKKSAEKLRVDAQAEADKIKQATDAALSLALRDASLKLREEVQHRFAAELKNLVSKHVRDEDFLKQALLEVTRQSLPADADGQRRVLLPASVLSEEDLRKNASELENGSLTQFAVTLAQDVLGRGIDIVPATDNRPGLRVEMKDGDIRVDATDQSLTQFLLKHLMPRFRVLMEGMAS
jgi:V/A-type H+-transporting ATPase subunit E